jgi:hypothetical protein
VRVDGETIERPGEFYAAAGNIGGLLPNADDCVFWVDPARFIGNDFGNQYLAGPDKLFGMPEMQGELALDKQLVKPLFSAPSHLDPVNAPGQLHARQLFLSLSRFR